MYTPNSKKRPVATGLILLCLSGAATTACSSDEDGANDAGDETASAGHAGASQGPAAGGNPSLGASSGKSSADSTSAVAPAGGAQNTSSLGSVQTGGAHNTSLVQDGGAPGNTGTPGSAIPNATGGGSSGTASGGSVGARAGSSALGEPGGTVTAGSTAGGTNSAGNGPGQAGAANSTGSTAGSSGTVIANAGSSGTHATSVPQIPSSPLPTVETESFTPTSSTVDIADDCAIYANPSAPELSVVVADNKDEQGGGVGVFDMQGKLLQFRQEGMMGNIDLRVGFPFGGQSIVLVGANNRTTKQLNFWQLDPATRRLSAPIGETPQTVTGSYGFCMYHSKVSGKFYAFVTETARVGAQVEQYELSESNGAVTATRVRSFQLSSITEGCVADDELGWLYVAQEDVALWRYGAEPEAGSAAVEVAAVGDGHLVPDLEGISLAKGPGTSGYLVLSIQSEDRFVVFDRETNVYLRGFTVGANASIDTVNQTDGLDISTANLGPGFPNGALVVHDGENADGASSNLKYVPLQ
ncbi:MAG TPA: phytase [Polyangiaceae bacterium]|nr:phytase [Polyangiaceae bacterium]